MKEKYVTCIFTLRDGQEYTFICPPDLDPQVGDMIVVEIQGGTFKLPFSVAKVTKIADQKPKLIKQMKLKYIHSIIEDLI